MQRSPGVPAARLDVAGGVVVSRPAGPVGAALARGRVEALGALAVSLAQLHDVATDPADQLATARALLATLTAIERAQRLSPAPGAVGGSAATTAGGSPPVADPVAELRQARERRRAA